MITINTTGLITTNGNLPGLNGDEGGNTYQIDGTIHTTGSSGEGVLVGDYDNLTLGATGAITTDATNTAEAIDGAFFDWCSRHHGRWKCHHRQRQR